MNECFPNLYRLVPFQWEICFWYLSAVQREAILPLPPVDAVPCQCVGADLWKLHYDSYSFCAYFHSPFPLSHAFYKIKRLVLPSVLFIFCLAVGSGVGRIPTAKFLVPKFFSNDGARSFNEHL